MHMRDALAEALEVAVDAVAVDKYTMHDLRERRITARS
jgi:hypothetical protein